MNNPNFGGPWADTLTRINRDLSDVWQRMLPSGSLDSPAFDSYRALFEGRKPEAQSGMPQRLMDQGKAFFGFVENMAKSLAGNTNASPQDFTNGLNSWLGNLNSQFAGNPFGAQGAGAGAFSGAFGGANFGNGAAAQFLKPMMQPFAINLDALKDQPTFGYSREKQEQSNALMADMGGYMRAMQAYQALIMQSQFDGVKRFQTSLNDSEASPIDSLRGLYDAYIDSAEEAFAETALKPEFRQVYGDLVNAQMRVKRHMMTLAENQSRDLGMPTRSEVITLAKTVHELKRSRSELVDVKRELAELKAAVAALQKQAKVKDAPVATPVAATVTAPVAKQIAAAPAPTATAKSTRRAPKKA